MHIEDSDCISEYSHRLKKELETIREGSDAMREYIERLEEEFSTVNYERIRECFNFFMGNMAIFGMNIEALCRRLDELSNDSGLLMEYAKIAFEKF